MLSPTLTAPACPTPAETIAAALDRVGPACKGCRLKIASGSPSTARKSSRNPETSFSKKASLPTE